MARSQHAIPKHLRGNAGACMAVTMQALRWEMDPFAVAAKTYSVNDLVAYEAQLFAAVVNTRAPIKSRPRYAFEGAGQELRCTVTVAMKDGSEATYKSPKVGTIKVKNSPLWTADPEQQLGYYSIRAWARRYCPEVILGVYSPDEIDTEAPRIGPDRARDVTPPRTLGNRLDALAAGPERQAPAAVDATPHDPETGEVVHEADPADSPADGAGAAADDLSPHDATLADVRARLMEGERLPAILNSLGDRRPLLTDDDVAGLRAAEKAMKEKGHG